MRLVLSNTTTTNTVDTHVYPSYIEKNSKVRIQSIVVPLSWYHINVNNYTLHFRDNAIDYVCLLTPGNYNISDICIELKTRMDAASAETYTVTYNNSTGKLTIACTGNYELLFSQSPDLAYILGFLPGDTFIAASNTSRYPVKLNAQYITLISENIEPISLNGAISNKIAIIPITKSVYTTQETIYCDIDMDIVLYNKLKIIKLYFEDEFGYIIEFNQSRFFITLEIQDLQASA